MAEGNTPAGFPFSARAAASTQTLSHSPKSALNAGSPVRCQ
jgi:hypothetical protein